VVTESDRLAHEVIMRGENVMRIAVIVGGALLVSACAGPDRTPAPVVLSQVELTPTQVAALEGKVKEKLKDPYSAVFGKRVAGRNELGSVVVCGQVNAKNGFGGYTGMSPYMAAISSAGAISVEVVSSDAFSIRYVADLCSKQGLQIGA
jgi:hypothetical protein